MNTIFSISKNEQFDYTVRLIEFKQGFVVSNQTID
jgi:hypothetical protein